MRPQDSTIPAANDRDFSGKALNNTSPIVEMTSAQKHKPCHAGAQRSIQKNADLVMPERSEAYQELQM